MTKQKRDYSNPREFVAITAFIVLKSRKTNVEQTVSSYHKLKQNCLGQRLKEFKSSASLELRFNFP